MVVDNHNLNRKFVFDEGSHFTHQHGEAAVAYDAYDLSSGIRNGRTNAVGQAVGHGGQSAGERELHPAPHVYVACSPSRNGAAVGADDGIVVQQLVQVISYHLRLHGAIEPRPALFHQFAPGVHSLLCGLQEATVLVSLQQRQEFLKNQFAVTDETDIGRVAQANTARININLHAADLARLRIKVEIRKAGSNDQQRVTFFDGIL